MICFTAYEFNNEQEIEAICKLFNFEIYIQIIKDFEINCNNLDVVDSNANNNGKKNLDDDLKGNIPYCGCFALNCLDQTKFSFEEQFKQKNFILKNKIKLPNKCINSFGYYQNEKLFKNHNLLQNIIDNFLAQEELP